MNSREQLFRGFIGAAFAAGEFGFGGNEFAPEGFGEDGLGEFVHPLPGAGELGFELVHQGEEGIDPADDFVLFGEGRELKRD